MGNPRWSHFPSTYHNSHDKPLTFLSNLEPYLLYPIPSDHERSLGGVRTHYDPSNLNFGKHTRQYTHVRAARMGLNRTQSTTAISPMWNPRDWTKHTAWVEFRSLFLQSRKICRMKESNLALSGEIIRSRWRENMWSVKPNFLVLP